MPLLAYELGGILLYEVLTYPDERLRRLCGGTFSVSQKDKSALNVYNGTNPLKAKKHKGRHIYAVVF